MAIYRLEKKSISRGNNHNLVAAVAYRAGAKFTDTNTKNPKATTHDYTQKTDVAHSEIVLPDELAEQLTQAKITLDLEQIANLVERGETTQRGKMKEKAKLASEYVLAGSHELSQAENIQAFQEFAKQQAEEQGVVAMVFVHDPKHGEDMSAGDSSKRGDLRNIHAHIVLLSRQLELSGDQLQLGNKSDSELSNADRKKKGLDPSRQWLKGVREQWADIQNQSLKRHNLAPVTHKSYQDLGLKFKPTVHLGKHATTLERMGKPTYLGAHNESVNRDNSAYLEFAAERLAGGTKHGVDRSERNIAWADDSIAWADDQISWAAGSTGELNSRASDSKQCIEGEKRNIAWAARANAEVDRVISSNSKITEHSERQIDDNQQRTEHNERQEKQISRVIENSTRRKRPTRPNPFDDEARRARAVRIAEQERQFDERERQFDTEASRNSYAAERAAEAVGRLKIDMAAVFLSRHHENKALQDWETVEEHPEKFDRRQIQRLDEFAQTIGADGKITDFSKDANRVSQLFTGAVVEQHRDIIKILRKPSAEREQHNILSPKTHSDAPQSDLNPLTRDNTNNTSRASNIANESVSVPSRRYRP